MNVLSQEEWKALLAKHQGWCISIFMPTFRTGAESQQNQIRLRNLLRKAEEKLLAYPELFAAPIVRNGRQATVGYHPEIWQTWE